MSSEKSKSKSRRDFLQKLGAVGAGAVSSAALLSSCSSKEESSGEKVKLLNHNNELVEVDKSRLKAISKAEDESYLLSKGRQGMPNRKFVMVVDLGKCKNARKCMTACQDAHQLKPEQHHINVLQMDDKVNGSTYYMPKPCQHCDNPS